MITSSDVNGLLNLKMHIYSKFTSMLKKMFCSKLVYKDWSNNDDFIDQVNTFLSFLWRDSWTGGACNYTKKSNTCNKTFSINMRDYLWYVPPAAIHKAAPHSESRKHSYTIFTKTVEKIEFIYMCLVSLWDIDCDKVNI